MTIVHKQYQRSYLDGVSPDFPFPESGPVSSGWNDHILVWIKPIYITVL